MAKRMDISIQRQVCIQLAFMSLGLKVLAGHALVINKRGVQVQVLYDLVIDFLHLIIKRLGFRRCIPETPRAREIVKIATALLGGEDIKDNGLAKRHQVLWVAHRMRNACIASDRKNETMYTHGT